MEFKDQNDVLNTVKWGYDYTLPIAQIIGAAYTTVETALGGASGITTLQSETDATLRSTLNALRTDVNLNEALVTTYTHDPLIGMTSQTDPNGVTTYYEYDGISRLELLKDNNDDIVSGYDYNYIPRPELFISTSSISTSNASGSSNVSIDANVAWTASGNSWITVSPGSGSNDGTITVSYTENTCVARTGTVTVSGPGVSPQLVTINQAGTTASPTLSLSSNYVYVSSGSDTFSVNLYSNANWEIANINYYSGSGWIGASAGSDNGSCDSTLNFIVSGSSGQTAEIIIETTTGTQSEAIYVSVN